MMIAPSKCSSIGRKQPRDSRNELRNIWPRSHGSVRLDASEFHHLGPLLRFRSYEFAEIGGRAWKPEEPNSTNRALSLGLTSPALISLLSRSMISGGVFLG